MMVNRILYYFLFSYIIFVTTLSKVQCESIEQIFEEHLQLLNVNLNIFLIIDDWIIMSMMFFWSKMSMMFVMPILNGFLLSSKLQNL